MGRYDASVIIPVFERPDLLRETVLSVLRQEGCTLDVIVVDDCSPTPLKPTLADLGSEVRVIRLDRNRGTAAARNAGARAARGEVLAFLDSDDLWLPTKMRTQLDKWQGDGASVTGICYVDEEGRRAGRPYMPPPTAYEKVFVQNQFLGSGSSLAISADSFHALGGFPEDRELAEDWILLVKLVRHGMPITVVPEPLVNVRLHRENYFTSDPGAIATAMWSSVEWPNVKPRSTTQHRGLFAVVPRA